MEVTKTDLLNYGFINRQCDGFIEAAFADAPEAQKADVKRIFMGGALIMFNVMTQYPEDVSDDEMMSVMMQFNNEFEAVALAAQKRALDS